MKYLDEYGRKFSQFDKTIAESHDSFHKLTNVSMSVHTVEETE